MRKCISGLLWAVTCGMMLLTGVSCEKMVIGSEADDGDDDANVVLRVASFEQIPFTLAKTRRDARDICTRLNFMVYKDGKRIKQESQKVDDEGFGKAEFRLAEGRYFLVALAHSGAGNPTSTRSDSIVFSNDTGHTDTFYWADSIFVDAEHLHDDRIDKTLNLERIVSKIRFEYLDDIPVKAKRIRFKYDDGTAKFNALTGYGIRTSKQLQWYDLPHTENTFEIYTIPHSNAQEYINVDVNSYDSSETEVSIRSVADIPILRNRVTICRGYLFSPVYGAGFDIRISDVWDPDTLFWDF